MRVEGQSSVLVLLATIASSLLAHGSPKALPALSSLSPSPYPSATFSTKASDTSFISPVPLSIDSDPIQHDEALNHRLHPRKASTEYPLNGPQQAWVDYYGYQGQYLGEDVTSSGDCLLLSFPTSWDIISITPMSTQPLDPKDQPQVQVILYNDPNCISVNHEPASRTGFTIIAFYFYRIPMSLRWIRTSPPNLSTPAVATKTSALSISASASASSLSISSSSISFTAATTATATIATATTNLSLALAPPTPIRTTFPTALIPPNPMDSATTGWSNDCSSDSDSGCQTKKHVTRVIVVGITVAVLVVGFMIAGSFYIYRTFYAPEQPSSSFFMSSTSNNNNNNNNSNNNNSNNPNNNSKDNSNTNPDHSDWNPGYQYNHDEDEDDGRPRFMFDHSHDNVNTNKNPKLFRENSTGPSPSSSSWPRYNSGRITQNNNNNASDICLLERIK
ncbi:hypothetical protein BGX28_008146 [Mortierella sp. GBA30]|nr:hypothetical protein BGX28_008146 [Mortierella sp. GBA30]